MKIPQSIKDVVNTAKHNSRTENTQIIATGVFKSVLGLVPVLGNTALEIYNGFQSKQVERKLRRLEEFYSSLDSNIQGVEESVNTEFINKEDFLDLFEEATRYVVLERHHRKRELFKNILSKSITSPEIDYDKPEKFFRLLDNLTELDLLVLAVLENPMKYNQQHGMVIPNPFHSEYQSSWSDVTAEEVITRLLNIKIHELDESISALFYNGLIVRNLKEMRIHTNGNPIHILDNLLTVKGRDFVNYLKG